MIAAAFLVLLRPYSIQCALFLLLLLLGTIATIVFFCCWHRRLHKGRHPIKSVFSGRSRSRGEGPGRGADRGAPAAGRGERGPGTPPGVSTTAQLYAQLRAGELNMNKTPGGARARRRGGGGVARGQPEVQPGAAPLFLLPFQMLS